MKWIMTALAISALAGCGSMQNYNQGLEANQNAWKRQQALLDEQNIIEVNKLKSLQREQEIQAARAEGQKTQAQAAGEAQADIERAKGTAESNRIVAASLTPAVLKQHLIDALDGKVMYLPSNVIINGLPDVTEPSEKK